MPRANGIAASLKNLCRSGLAAGVIGLGVVSPASGGVGCNSADLAPPFGVLDLADVNAFTNAFVNQLPAADLNNDGVFDLADINQFVADFTAGCPASDCYPDIRTTIDGAYDDDADVQANYDGINRTIHIFGPMPLVELYSSTPAELLPFVFDRLQSLEHCTGLPTDIVAYESAFALVADVAGTRTVGQIAASLAGTDPGLEGALQLLRDLGIGVPDLAPTPLAAQGRLNVLPILLGGAGDITLADMFFKTELDVSEAQFFAVETGKNSGLVAAAICGNSRCCSRGTGSAGTDQCLTRSQYCNLPPPSRAYCSLASDRCP